jgi:formyl-CoA transferase
MLAGVRVIEVGTTITAPLSALLLADLGADVIKVERPEGDPFRAFRGGSNSPHFIAYNRNKRSVVIDLTTDEGRAQMHALLADADVLIDNLRPNVLPRVGLDPALLRGTFPRLIHCSITGFGSSGPKRDRPAFDAVAQALSGMSSLFLDPDEPHVTGPTLSDNVTGMYACIGILGALNERQRTGNGKRLEVNMLESSMAFIGDAFANATMLGVLPDTRSRAAASQSYAFRCSDGGLIAIHLSSIEKFWTNLCRALESPGLVDDPRYAKRMDRFTNYAELSDVLGTYFAQRPRAEWMERLDTNDIPNAAVNTIDEAMADPQTVALGTFFSMQHPTEGTIASIHSPIHADGQRITPQRPAPTLGADTADLLG